MYLKMLPQPRFASRLRTIPPRDKIIMAGSLIKQANLREAIAHVLTDEAQKQRLHQKLDRGR